MKNIVLILFLFISSVPCAWAQDLAMAATEPAVEHTILGGVVKSITWADPAKGTESQIIVTDADKKKISALVTATTTLWDKDAEAIMPNKIVSKMRVNIIYLTTDEGVNVAKSIKILK